MFKSGGTPGDLNGFLDAGSHIRGELHFEDTFRVDGAITGKVVSKGDFVIGERGRVQGDIYARRVFVSGEVKGKIVATERLEVAVQGRVEGEIESPSFYLEDGAFFQGKCAMGPVTSRPDRAVATPELAPDGAQPRPKAVKAG